MLHSKEETEEKRKEKHKGALYISQSDSFFIPSVITTNKKDNKFYFEISTV